MEPIRLQLWCVKSVNPSEALLARARSAHWAQCARRCCPGQMGRLLLLLLLLLLLFLFLFFPPRDCLSVSSLHKRAWRQITEIQEEEGGSEGGRSPRTRSIRTWSSHTHAQKRASLGPTFFLSFYLKNTFFVIKDLATKCSFVSVCITHTPTKLRLFLVLRLKVIWPSSGGAGLQFDEQSD